MAIFRAFRAFRPTKENQSLIPELPYDVMNSDEAREMARDNDLSFLHIDKAEIDLDKNVDLYSKEVYEKAKENLLKLENSGAMIQDDKPCLYIYRQIMDGKSQVGLVGCASIDDYKNNVIKKHENTLAKKEQDRINHVNTCDANTGPIFLTYRDNKSISALINSWMKNHEHTYDFEKAGARQTVWVINDALIVDELQRSFDSVKAMYIADGHHRCASAVKVGDMRRKENPSYDGSEEFNYFLAVAFPDDELQIMDYNRVVRDLNGYSFEEFLDRVKEKFDVEKHKGQCKPAQRHTFGMYYNKEWYLLKAKAGTFNEDDCVDRLDVSILQENLLDRVLGIEDPKNDDRIDFIGGIRGLDELEKRANSDMVIAFSMYPTSIDDLMSIADDGKIMPPKSTWFEPKLLSGLFIHHLS